MTRHLAWILLAACGGDRSAVDAPTVTTGDLYVTVMNVGGHCSVTVNGGEPFTTEQGSVADFTPGQTVPVTAVATTGFTLGLWHHSSHDTGSGDPGTITDIDQVVMSSASVALGDSPGCAWICCGSSSAACPAADPCL
jgi:hypothetical protein